MTDAPARPALYVGLDLGQTADPSALVALEEAKGAKPVQRGRGTASYCVRFVRRWLLGTSYTAVVDDVAKLFAAPPLTGSALAVDVTGVGGPVRDMFRAAN